MVSLDDFATAKRQDEKKHKKCLTCNFPADVLADVEEGRELQENGKPKYTYEVICNWLSTQDIDIPPTTLANHFKFNHHLGK